MRVFDQPYDSLCIVEKYLSAWMQKPRISEILIQCKVCWHNGLMWRAEQKIHCVFMKDKVLYPPKRMQNNLANLPKQRKSVPLCLNMFSQEWAPTQILRTAQCTVVSLRTSLFFLPLSELFDREKPSLFLTFPGLVFACRGLGKPLHKEDCCLIYSSKTRGTLSTFSHSI